jgi:dihydrofolate synthase / folylpolyglutamate synthase
VTYEEAERELLARELFGMRFGLDRMRRLLVALGSPERTFGTAVHVVGSNGKSSTTRVLAALLGGSAYLSPHLVRFSERVLLDGRDASPEAFAAAVGRGLRAAAKVERGLGEGERVTQFELLTASCFDLLRGRDVVVVEAGLGGRWDATNVLDSAMTVLTSVALEHTRWLGATHEHIAREKLEVLRPGTTLVVGEDLHPDARAVADELVAERDARLVVAPMPAGGFDARNRALALAAARALRPALGEDALTRAAAVTVPGRLEQDGDLLLDGAHNPAGMVALAEALGDRRGFTAVVSILDDKDAPAMLGTLLPHCARVVCTRCANPRALPADTLRSLVEQLGGEAEAVDDPHRALARARELAAGGPVLATGSLYLLADLRAGAGAARRRSAL